MKKEYKCCICGEVLNEYKPIRLVEQHYKDEPGYYKQYYHYKNYDFCKKCFNTFRKWINKYKEKGEK